MVLHVSFRLLYVRNQCILGSLWTKVMTCTAPVRTLRCPAEEGQRYSALFDSTLGSRVQSLQSLSSVAMTSAQCRVVTDLSCLVLVLVLRSVNSGS